MDILKQELWEAHRNKLLKSIGWTEVLRGSSVFTHKTIPGALSIYVDDFVLACHASMAGQVWKEIGQVIRLGPVESLTRFLGCEFAFHKGVDHLKVEISMPSFISSCVDEYCKALPAAKLKKVSTPFLDVCDFDLSRHLRETAGTSKNVDVSWQDMVEQTSVETLTSVSRGALADKAASLVMKCLWCARIARPDVCVAVTKLARHICKWSPEDDRRMHRLICYLWSSKSYVLVGKIGTNIAKWSLDTYCDADFAGEAKDGETKSTSGQMTVLTSGENGEFSMPLSWCSTKQSCTARSTPEAEITSASRALFSNLLPLYELWRTLLKDGLPACLQEDNEAARIILKKGYSTALSYLNRTQKVNLAAISELLQETISIKRCPTDMMKGDPLTKVFSPSKWDAALLLMGVEKRV
jgi:hypothetical protein